VHSTSFDATPGSPTKTDNSLEAAILACSPLKKKKARIYPKTPPRSENIPVAANSPRTPSPKKRSSSSSSYPGTPSPNVIRYTKIPKAPKRKQSLRVNKRVCFTNLQTCTQLPGDYFPFKVPLNLVTIHGHYFPHNNQSQLCIKQPDYDLSCGVGATLMMLSHFFRCDQALTLDNRFWNWYGKSPFLNIQDITKAIDTNTNFPDQGYEARGVFFQKQFVLDYLQKIEGVTYRPIENFTEDLLSKLKSIQSICQSPMIVSVTNKELAGHWIVIDRITEDSVYLRDPYQGQGFCIPLSEMYENWDAEDEVKVIYCLKSAQ